MRRDLAPEQLLTTLTLQFAVLSQHFVFVSWDAVGQRHPSCRGGTWRPSSLPLEEARVFSPPSPLPWARGCVTYRTVAVDRVWPATPTQEVTSLLSAGISLALLQAVL